MKLLNYILALVALSASGFASVAFHAVGTAANINTAASTGATGTFAVSTGDTIVAVVAQKTTTSTVTSITDTIGNTFTKRQACNNSTTERVEIWIATSTGTNASNAVTANLSATSKFVLNAASYSGVNWIGNGVCNTAAAANPTLTFNALDANNFIVGGFSGNSTGTFTASVGNLRQSAVNASSGVGGAIMDNTVSTINTALTVTATNADTSWAKAAIELRGSAKVTPAKVQCTSTPSWAGVATGHTKSIKFALPQPTISGNTVTAQQMVGGSSNTFTFADDKADSSTSTTANTDSNNAAEQIAVFAPATAGAQVFTLTTSADTDFNNYQICEWTNVAPVGANAIDVQVKSGTGSVATGGAVTGTSLKAGTLTPNVDNGLLIQHTEFTNWTGPADCMQWTPGSGFTMATWDPCSYSATEFEVLGAGGAAVTPAITSSLSAAGSMSTAIVLKPGPSGSQPPTTVPYIVGRNTATLENGTTYALYSGTSFHQQGQCDGGLIVLAWTGRPTDEFTTITSSPSLPWSHAASSANSGGSGNAAWFWWAPCTPGTWYTHTVSGFSSTPNAAIFNWLDIANANATNPVDTAATTSYTNTNASQPTSGGTAAITGATVTTTYANELILLVAQEDQHTATAISPGNFMAPDVGVYSASSGETDQGLANYVSATATSNPFTWTYSGYETGSTGVGAYANQAIAIEPLTVVTPSGAAGVNKRRKLEALDNF